MHVISPRFFIFPSCDALSLRFFDVNVEGIVGNSRSLLNTQLLSSPHPTTTTASEYICVSFQKNVWRLFLSELAVGFYFLYILAAAVMSGYSYTGGEVLSSRCRHRRRAHSHLGLEERCVVPHVGR